MKIKSASAGFDARRHLKILKAILIATNSFVLFMYASIFFVFADMPFNAIDELKNIGNAMAWATGFGLGFSFLIFAGDGITYLVKNRRKVKFPASTAQTPDYAATGALIIDMHAAPMDNLKASNN